VKSVCSAVLCFDSRCDRAQRETSVIFHFGPVITFGETWCHCEYLTNLATFLMTLLQLRAGVDLDASYMLAELNCAVRRNFESRAPQG
jgi:hypothetical protein